MGNANSGRRPNPTALTVLRGNPGRRKPNENEVRPPAGTVTKPVELSVGAGKVWDELAPVCLAMGTLTVADVQPFMTLCEIQHSFHTVVSLKGTDKFEPRAERDTAAALRPYYLEFGLTPASRPRISVPKTAEAPVSKWAELK